MLKAILWDNDGVLVDTEGLYFEATRSVMAPAGFELTHELYRQLFLTEDRGAWHLLSVQGTPDSEIIRLRQTRDDAYAAMLLPGRPLLPGVEATLEHLSARFRMAVVTSSARKPFDLIHATNQLGRFVEFVLCREDYRASKPDPEPYRLAMTRLGLTPEQCLVIEDSPRGLIAAKAAGVRCWVIPSGLTQGMNFAGADRILNNIDELQSLLD